MNRRGFFGTVAALPALLRGKLPLPPVPIVAPVIAASGLEAWLPAADDSPFFGIDRSVYVGDSLSASTVDYREALTEACNRALRETW